MLSGRGFLLTEKNKHLLTINHKSETKSFDGVTYPFKFGERYDLIQSLIRYVKNVQFVQSLNWILRIYKYVMVLKESVKTDQFGQSPN